MLPVTRWSVRRLTTWAMVAGMALTGCSQSDGADRSAHVPVEEVKAPLPTGQRGAERLARLVEKNLAVNNPKSDEPIVTCSTFDRIAAGVQVPCNARFGVEGPFNDLTVQFTDARGNFRFGPGVPDA